VLQKYKLLFQKNKISEKTISQKFKLMTDSISGQDSHIVKDKNQVSPLEGSF
jgi:hypothetical protein